MLWTSLYVVATVMLFLHWKGRNAVWGGATLGLLTGVVAALFRNGFDWVLVAHFATIATLLGTVTEWVPRLLSRMLQSSRSDAPTEDD